MNLAERESRLRTYFKSHGIYEYNLFDSQGLQIIAEIQEYTRKIAQVLNLGTRTPYKLLPHHSYLKQLEPHLQYCTNRLFETHNYHWQLNELEVMRSGKSYPLKCNLYTPNLGINETIYVKNYNITESARPFGLLLLSYSTHTLRDYEYIISDNILIEKEVKGIQIPINHPSYQQASYQFGLIEMALSSLKIGLKDIEIFDQSYTRSPMNYVVNQHGIHVPIDLEYLTPYTPEEIHGLHKLIQLRLQLSPNNYLKFVQDIYSNLHSPISTQQNELQTLAQHIVLLTPPHFNQNHYTEYVYYITQDYLDKYIYLLT